MKKKYEQYSILVVDDDKNTLEDITEYLETKFNKVFAASNAKEAFELFEQKNPDIILTDIVMPDVNGLDFVYDVRSKNQNIPIIIYSGYHEDDKLFRAIKLCVVDYLIKPINLEKLTQALNSSINKIKMFKPIVHLGQNYKWNARSSILYKNNAIINLTKNETALMRVFVQNIGIPLEAEFIYDAIWDDYEYNIKSIRDLISKLRKKLPNDVITNVYGGQYLLNEADSKDSEDIYSLNAIDLFESLENYIFVADISKEEKQIVYVNKALLKHLGYKNINDIDENSYQIIENIKPILEKVQTEQKKINMPLEIVSTCESLMCSISPIKNKNTGEIQYFLFDCTDESIEKIK